MSKRVCLIVLLQIVLNKSCLSGADVCSSAKENDSFIISKIHLRLYTGDSRSSTTRNFSVDQAQNILNFANPAKGSVLYIHGFRENAFSESVETIVNAYLQKGDDNIIILDWGDLAFDNYVLVVCRSKVVGKIIANAIDKILQVGLDLNTLHIIGHSAGAHIAGFIGRYSKNVISRITGLDPANPGYYKFPVVPEHIDDTVARFVDIIHTDGGIYGTVEPTGTVDFFANGGSRPQPGCGLIGTPLSPTDFCSHWTSWRYYAETVIRPDAFLAVKCVSYGEYLLGHCKDHQRIYVGYSTPKNISGKYYFDVTSKHPLIRPFVKGNKNK